MRCILVSLTAVVLSLSGCGVDDGRESLSGNVTFDGQPLAYGEIVFRPTEGPEGTATVRDGKYDTDDGGQGITKGPNTVIVTGYAAEPPSSTDETKSSEAASPLFLGYQQQADLSSATFDITVPKEAANSAAAPKIPSRSQP
jgi:hypothetical protein